MVKNYTKISGTRPGEGTRRYATERLVILLMWAVRMGGHLIRVGSTPTSSPIAQIPSSRSATMHQCLHSMIWVSSLSNDCRYFSCHPGVINFAVCPHQPNLNLPQTSVDVPSIKRVFRFTLLSKSIAVFAQKTASDFQPDSSLTWTAKKSLWTRAPVWAFSHPTSTPYGS